MNGTNDLERFATTRIGADVEIRGEQWSLTDVARGRAVLENGDDVRSMRLAEFQRRFVAQYGTPRDGGTEA